MADLLNNPALWVALLSLVGTVILAIVSARNAQLSASNEISEAAAAMVAQYRVDLEDVRNELNKVKAEYRKMQVDYEIDVKRLNAELEIKTKEHKDALREISLLRDRVRWLEDRLDTGPLKE